MRGTSSSFTLGACTDAAYSDFSRNISTPEAFMAIARQTFSTGSAAPNSPSSTNSVPTSVVGQQPEQPNSLGQTKPKIVIPPGLGPPSTTDVTANPVNKRPVSKAPGPSTQEVTATPVDRHPFPQAPPRSTPRVTATPVRRRPISKAPNASAPQATDAPVNKRPAPNAPGTPTPPARAPHPTPMRSGPAPVSQRTPAEVRTREAHAVPVRSPAPNPAIEPHIATESIPGTDLEKSNDDAGKNTSACLLLDVDTPAEVSRPDLQKQVMSPGCAELTGLDFPSAEKPRVVFSPSTSLARSETQSAAANFVRSELLKTLHRLSQTSRLAQQLIDIAHGTSDGLVHNLIKTFLAGSSEAQELAAAFATSAQPSSTRMSLVEDWLSRAPADQVLSLERTALELAKSSFDTYRSPVNTVSSSGSAQKRSPDSLTPGLSPRKIAPSEGMFGIENLRLSDEPSKTSADMSGKATSSVMQTRASNSLAQSIHAAPSLGNAYPERLKATGTRPSQSKAYQGSVRGSSSTSATRHVASAWTTTPAGETEQPSPSPPPRYPPGFFQFAAGDQPAQASLCPTGRGPAPKFPPGLGPFALNNPTTGGEAVPASSESRQSTGPKIIGVKPWQPKTTGPKIIGPAPYDPQRSVSTGPKIVGPPPFDPRIRESSGSQILGILSYTAKSREFTGPKITGPALFIPNYPVVRPSTDTVQPDKSRATSPQAPSTTDSAQTYRQPSVTIIGPKPYIPGMSIFGRPTTNEPLSSGSSNVPKTTSATASPGSKPGPNYRPSPLSRWLDGSIWASTPVREQRSVSQASSRQTDTQTSVPAPAPRAENKAPPKVRVIGPQPYIPKD